MKTKMPDCKSRTPGRGKLSQALWLAICLAAVSASAQTVLFNFPFNEGSGTNIASSVNTLPGTLGMELVADSAPTFSTDTPSGLAGDYSIAFASVVGDYTGNRIHVEDPGLAIDVTDPITGTNRSFTFQCWVKFGEQPGARATLFDNNGPGMKANIAILGDRSIALTTYGILDMTSSAKVVDDGMWHHIAVVHEDGVEVRFCIDGIVRDIVTYTNGVNVNGPQAYFHMGMEVWDWPEYGSGVNPFVGKIDRMSLTRGVVAVNDLDWRPVSGVTPSAPSLASPKPAIEISWPTMPAGYLLQSTTNVADTNSWVNVVNSPSAVGPGTYYFYGPVS
ncbi:MAG: hypothetical protein KBH45_08705, partial [Verrucomicrobia bacterium]|nr:hypothetical protein [Verrucomicrobiota bacterium]